MGLTFLAAGTSVPEAVSSVIVTNQGMMYSRIVQLTLHYKHIPHAINFRVVQANDFQGTVQWALVTVLGRILSTSYSAWDCHG